MQANEIKVFYSYSHKDEKLRDRLETHLALLKRDGVISTWHDRRIGAGSDWREAIHEQLNSSQIILLLISADFLASDYCFDIELKRAMELHEGGDARVIPIILRPCEWVRAPFGRVHVLPRDARPVIHWRDHDSAFTDIAHGIREAVSLLRIRSLEKEVAQGLEKKVKPKPSKPKIIVADDERVISNTFAIICNQAGFDARAVYSGEATLNISQQHPPDLLVTDVIMMGMTGIESAIEIRRMFPNCKILLISGQAATADLLERARQEGHEFEILAKPVHPTDMLAYLRGKPIPKRNSAALPASIT